jgi:FG-GAP repeat protein
MMKRKKHVFQYYGFIFYCIFVIPGLVQADWPEYDKVTASDGQAGDWLGKTGISISGVYAIVGADGDDDNGSRAGAAYIFQNICTSWNEQVKLKASDGAADDYFGYSVSISGDYAIVGAYGDDYSSYPERGAAYIFFRSGTGWTEQVKLVPPDAGQNNRKFGYAVAIDGDYAIVGAPGDTTNGGNAGAAYIFKRNGISWDNKDKLLADDGDTADWFGNSVSISGDYVVGGAYNEDPGGISVAGSAYIFKRETGLETWAQQAKLTASDGAISDRFGWSVSIYGDYAIAGAPYHAIGGDQTGAAYVFVRDGVYWNEQDKLTASDKEDGDQFGRTVGMGDGYAVAGAYFGDNENGDMAGAAYIFEDDGGNWSEMEKIVASDGQDGNYFGSAVAIDGGDVSVGAYLDEDFAGSTYFFRRSGTDDYLPQEKRTAGDASTCFGQSVCVKGDDAIVGSSSEAAYILTLQNGYWAQQAKLSPLDTTGGFGISVAIDGDYAIVGAYRDDQTAIDAGAAYIFKRTGQGIGTTWSQHAKLLASDGALSDDFGYSVSISGNYAIVGAWDAAGGGAAYIFYRSANLWTEQQKLTASGGFFGMSVSIDGDYALIGADAENSYKGAAYIFKRDGSNWAQQARLIASDRADNDHFGIAVCLDDDDAIIGAWWDDDNGNSSGSAYVFVRDGANWNEQDKLTASDGAANDYFGGSVSICGDNAVVGSKFDDDRGDDSGSAYRFLRTGTTWSQQAKLTSCDGYDDDNFGSAVSIDNGYIFVGSPRDDDHGSDSGSVYIFERICPLSDLTGDCFVNLPDFSVMAAEWLEGGDW